MTSVFLSFAAQDREAADRISRALWEHGYEVVRLDEVVKPGDRIVDRIADPLSEADWVVLLLSRATNSSPFALEEASLAAGYEALRGRPRLLPVLIEAGARPPLPIDQYFYLDMSTPGRFTSGLPKLVEKLAVLDVPGDRSKTERLEEERAALEASRFKLQLAQRRRQVELGQSNGWIASTLIGLSIAMASILFTTLTLFLTGSGGETTMTFALTALTTLVVGAIGFYFGFRTRALLREARH